MYISSIIIISAFCALITTNIEKITKKQQQR